MPKPDPKYVDWLVGQSMLNHARVCSVKYVGNARQWQRPYADARPRTASAVAPVWFTAYPAAMIAPAGDSVLKTLGDERMLAALSSIGIHGIHTGPMKRAGGLKAKHYTPTVDGNFDRVSLEIDPEFGTHDEYVALSRNAAAFNIIIIDDVVPAHTGKGADWRLAEMAYQDYPGLYHMVEIREEDWPLLPKVPKDRDSLNLLPDAVDQLRDKGYIIGQLQRVIFFEPGVKETDWSATGVVTGVDGVDRRWVYLHYFKDGQPSLNWLDPSFAAQTMIVGDALHSLDSLGARGIRLDANGFLGAERRATGPAWSEGHPLSVVGNQILSGMVRKVGGFTFQELNLTIDDIAAMSKGGADLSYDFINRPAYHHALVTGDAEFLRLMLRQIHHFSIEPASLIHALQNHDELTLELVHFWTAHAQDVYRFRGEDVPGIVVRDQVRNAMYDAISGDAAPYNHRFVTNGVACTTVSLIAAALKITDLGMIGDREAAAIQKAHILLVMFNALQPGVFALSGWDLVGALPLDLDQVSDLAAQGDTRWINRGAYDLVSVNPKAKKSHAGLPKARVLYGPLDEQLKSTASFASQIKHILAVRKDYDIGASHQILLPEVSSPGLVVMVHELPAERGIQITALNFSRDKVEEAVSLPGVAPGAVMDILNGRVMGDLGADGLFTFTLAPHEGLCLRVVETLAPSSGAF
jgi:trehalose synthase